MSAHGVDVFNFEFWDGAAPALTQEQVTTHTRPGANGVGQTLAGVWERSFEAVLTADYNSYLSAMVGFNLMRFIVGTGPVQVKYNNINYLGTFGHLYFVDRVTMVSCKVHPRLIGPTYSFIGGARLRVRFRMTPHATA